MEYRFSRCSINTRTREIRLDEALRNAPRKVFDVLEYLIKHRDRVVRRDELLEKVWLGRAFDKNICSRAVMLARDAVGDDSEEPTIIRTVQRVGYRFMADVEERLLSDSPALRTDNLPLAERPELIVGLRLGFLPFSNETGDRNLAWVELGLLSLVIQRLNQNSRFSVLSTASVLQSVELEGGGTTEQERAARLMELFGVKVVISASVIRFGNLYKISFRSLGYGKRDFEDSVSGPELTGLAFQLAEHLERRLLPSEAHSVAAPSSDYFVNECFSRGMVACDASRWEAASKFFEIASMMEPESVTVGMQYAYVLAQMGDPSAIGRARDLVSDAQDRKDVIAEARASYILALALFESGAEPDAANLPVDRSIDLMHENVGEEWRIRAYLLKYEIAFVQQKFQTCGEVLDAAQRACEEDGNRLAMLVVASNRASVQWALGNNVASCAAVREVIALCRQFGDVAGELQALGNLVTHEFSRGRFDECVQAGDEFVQTFEAVEHPPIELIRAARAYIFVGVSELRLTEKMVDWRDRLTAATRPSSHYLAKSYTLFRDALIEQSRGQLESCCRLLLEARESLNKTRQYHEFATLMRLLVLNLLRLGRWDEARTECRLMESLGGFTRDARLRIASTYFAACFAWQERDVLTCLARLEEGVSQPWPGIWQAFMRFDLAWLYLLQGEASEANSVLGDVSPWVERHPAGLVVGAMLACRNGAFDLGRDRHRRHVHLVGAKDMTRFGDFKSVQLERHVLVDQHAFDLVQPSRYWVSR